MANIIELMQKVGLKSDARGVCLGLANTASMAYLAGSEAFEHAIKRFNRLDRLDINDTQAVEQLITDPKWEVMAFLESVELFQNASLYKHLQQSLSTSSLQNLRNLIQSNLLEQQGGAHQIGSFSGLYSRGDFLLYLNSFRDICDNQTPPTRQTLILTTNNHAIMLAYNAEKKGWTISANGFVYEAEAQDTAEVAEALFDFFQAESMQEFASGAYLALETELYSTGQQYQQVASLLNDWQQTPSFQAIHRVTKIKAQAKDALGANWLLIASRNGDLALIKQLIGYGADVNLAATAQYTPLHIAIICPAEGVVSYLLANGANPHLISNIGGTPLALALLTKNISAIEQILAHDPSTVNSLILGPSNDDNLPSGQSGLSYNEFILTLGHKFNISKLFCDMLNQIPSEQRCKKIEKAANSEQARQWMYTEALRLEFHQIPHPNLNYLIELVRDKPIDMDQPAFIRNLTIGEEMLLLAFSFKSAELYQLTCQKLLSTPNSISIEKIASYFLAKDRPFAREWFTSQKANHQDKPSNEKHQTHSNFQAKAAFFSSKQQPSISHSSNQPSIKVGPSPTSSSS